MTKSDRKQWMAGGLLIAWFAGMSLIAASLMVGHWITLPHPETNDQQWASQLVDAKLELEASSHDGEKWTALHFLYGDCACSRRILKLVAKQAPNPDANERIVLIGEAPELAAQAVEQGYGLDQVTPQQLMEKYGIESAPFLVVMDPQGTPKYAGGYTSRKQGLDAQHDDIIAQLIAGEDVESLPLYGCAVSKRLKTIVDPLGLKYD